MSPALRALDPGTEGSVCPGFLRRKSLGSQGSPRALLVVSVFLLGWLNLDVSMTRDYLQICPWASGHGRGSGSWPVWPWLQFQGGGELRPLPRDQVPSHPRALQGMCNKRSCLFVLPPESSRETAWKVSVLRSGAPPASSLGSAAFSLLVLVADLERACSGLLHVPPSLPFHLPFPCVRAVT